MSVGTPRSEKQFEPAGSSSSQTGHEGSKRPENEMEIQTPQDSDEEARDPRQRKIEGLPWGFLVVALVSMTFLFAMDNTILANIRPPIIEAFGRVDLLPWVSVSYAMAESGASLGW
jgi:hypothetical protein